MQVQAQIRSLTDVSQSADKPMFKVAIETDMPLGIIEFRCFSNDVSNGNVEKLRRLLGKHCMLPLEAKVYNGAIQYGLPFGENVPTTALAAPEQEKKAS